MNKRNNYLSQTNFSNHPSYSHSSLKDSLMATKKILSNKKEDKLFYSNNNSSNNIHSNPPLYSNLTNENIYKQIDNKSKKITSSIRSFSRDTYNADKDAKNDFYLTTKAK
jgi:hypothetical protein